MARAWHGWYHCMGHTYGTWLSGDARGFRTRHHRDHVEGDYKNPPPRGKYERLHEHAKGIMAREPVYLTPEQRVLVVQLLVASLVRHGVEVAAGAVTEVHFHLLPQVRDGQCRHWLGVAKKESSHYAKAAGQGVEGGIWAVRTKNVPILGRVQQLRTAKYVYDHLDEGAAVWINGCVIAPRCLRMR